MANTFTVGQVADRLGVTYPTVRNWSARYASHLSPDANPPTGTERRFTERDVNVLAYVGQCVADKMRHDAIEEQLQSTSFGDTLENNAQDAPEDASRSNTSNEGAIVAPGASSTVDYAPVLYDLVQVTEKRHDETVSRLDKLERQRHGAVMLAAGIGIGIGLVVLALLLLRVM